MLTQEYYIRGINDTEARGPFTVDHLVTLGDTGQIDAETLFYDAATEQWSTISSNEELRNAVFPPKRKLEVKPKNNVTTLNVPKEEYKPITVQQMLAAAEGRTEETRDKRHFMMTQLMSAKIGMYAALLIFVLSAGALILPHIEIVMALNFEKIAEEPLIYLGFIDLVCVVLLALGMVAAYPFIRFRAALGAGFLGLLFISQDQPLVAMAVACGSLGLYLCTIFLTYISVIAAAVLGLAGIGGFAYFMLT